MPEHEAAHVAPPENPNLRRAAIELYNQFRFNLVLTTGQCRPDGDSESLEQLRSLAMQVTPEQVNSMVGYLRDPAQAARLHESMHANFPGVVAQAYAMKMGYMFDHFDDVAAEADTFIGEFNFDALRQIGLIPLMGPKETAEAAAVTFNRTRFGIATGITAKEGHVLLGTTPAGFQLFTLTKERAKTVPVRQIGLALQATYRQYRRLIAANPHIKLDVKVMQNMLAVIHAFQHFKKMQATADGSLDAFLEGIRLDDFLQAFYALLPAQGSH